VRNLPFEFIARKNKVNNPDAWIWLLQIQTQNDDFFLLTSDNVCTEYKGEIYDPYDLEVGELSLSSDGDLPEISIDLSNHNQQIAAFVEANDGLIGNIINIKLINLETPFAEAYEETLEVIECDIGKRISFTCSYFAISSRGFPGLFYLRDFCRWEFTGAECLVPASVVNPGETCTKRKEGNLGCEFWGDREVAATLPRQHPNRFGAFPTMPVGFIFEV